MAQRPLRLLYLEDRRGFQYEVKKAVQRVSNRLTLDIAQDVETARQLLRSNFYHLLVLDINIEPVKSDLSNRDGLDFLMWLNEHNLLGNAFEACILTAHSNPEYATATLNKTRAIGYYNKQHFSRTKFIEWVDEMQRNQFNYPLNLSLNIENLPALVPLLEADTRFANATVSTETLALELEDLLCRVFADNDRVSLVSDPDFSATDVMTLHIRADEQSYELRIFYLVKTQPATLKQEMKKDNIKKKWIQTTRFGVFVPVSPAATADKTGSDTDADVSLPETDGNSPSHTETNRPASPAESMEKAASSDDKTD